MQCCCCLCTMFWTLTQQTLQMTWTQDDALLALYFCEAADTSTHWISTNWLLIHAFDTVNKQLTQLCKFTSEASSWNCFLLFPTRGDGRFCSLPPLPYRSLRPKSWATPSVNPSAASPSESRRILCSPSRLRGHRNSPTLCKWRPRKHLLPLFVSLMRETQLICWLTAQRGPACSWSIVCSCHVTASIFPFRRHSMTDRVPSRQGVRPVIIR